MAIFIKVRSPTTISAFIVLLIHGYLIINFFENSYFYSPRAKLLQTSTKLVFFTRYKNLTNTSESKQISRNPDGSGGIKKTTETSYIISTKKTKQTKGKENISVLPVIGSKHDLTFGTPESVESPLMRSGSINRDLTSIRRALEHDQFFEQQKLEAAKPPNQIVREYWEKQNYPFHDKRDELRGKLAQAGKPPGTEIETYTRSDGSKISKVNGRCYKAPDPGRTYLHQPEVRQVTCLR
ncbi:hypothetical protein [Undibacterium fentianense]|uniref:Uncharacterized protein n=1 Tax=Undibacterium fentianense TaxID=2828728 RepID=A0A941E5J5_9BURK|nr:hypothetical protein [Undibacterium fentianense]MBR7801014.1 hypothetical protein [Undibacterium fentianense]